ATDRPALDDNSTVKTSTKETDLEDRINGLGSPIKTSNLNKTHGSRLTGNLYYDLISDQSITDNKMSSLCEIEDLENGQLFIQNHCMMNTCKQMKRSGSLPNINKLSPIESSSTDIECKQVVSEYDNLNLQQRNNQTTRVKDTSTIFTRQLKDDDDDDDDDEDIELVRRSMLQVILTTTSNSSSINHAEDCSHNSTISEYNESEIFNKQKISIKQKSFSDNLVVEENSMHQVQEVHSEGIQRRKYSCENVNSSRKRSGILMKMNICIKYVY
ncbi:hypothetical protein EWB00_003663, partial [Schistosoma japonicum]